jgi:hypothetical protein
MKQPFMTEAHQTAQPWAFQLERRQAVTLLAEAAPRWLRVDNGRVWITAREGGPDSEDIWLEGGQTLALPAGSAWVLEASPQAQLSLLQAAPAAFRHAAAPSSRSPLHAWWQRWSWSAVSVVGA